MRDDAKLCMTEIHNEPKFQGPLLPNSSKTCGHFARCIFHNNLMICFVCCLPYLELIRSVWRLTVLTIGFPSELVLVTIDPMKNAKQLAPIYDTSYQEIRY